MALDRGSVSDKPSFSPNCTEVVSRSATKKVRELIPIEHDQGIKS